MQGSVVVFEHRIRFEVEDLSCGHLSIESQQDQPIDRPLDRLPCVDH